MTFRSFFWQWRIRNDGLGMIRTVPCHPLSWGSIASSFVHLGLTALAVFILLLELLGAFFGCYSFAKRKGQNQEKQHSDEMNKVGAISGEAEWDAYCHMCFRRYAPSRRM